MFWAFSLVVRRLLLGFVSYLLWMKRRKYAICIQYFSSSLCISSNSENGRWTKKKNHPKSVDWTLLLVRDKVSLESNFGRFFPSRSKTQNLHFHETNSRNFSRTDLQAKMLFSASQLQFNFDRPDRSVSSYCNLDVMYRCLCREKSQRDNKWDRIGQKVSHRSV